MKHDISLLRRMLRDEVRKALPCHEVLRPDDTGRSRRRREVRIRLVLALGAEHAVDPAVLVLREAHIVDIRLVRARVIELNRVIPEMKPVDAVVALRDSEEGFSVISLDPDDQIVLAVQHDRAGVQRRVDAKPLNEVRVCLRVKIISPVERDHVPCHDRVLIAREDAVIEIGLLVLSCEQLVLLRLLNIILWMQHVIFLQVA